MVEYNVSKKLPKGRAKDMGRNSDYLLKPLWKQQNGHVERYPERRETKKYTVGYKNSTSYRCLNFLRKALCMANKSIKTFFLLSSTFHTPFIWLWKHFFFLFSSGFYPSHLVFNIFSVQVIANNARFRLYIILMRSQIGIINVCKHYHI